MTLRPLPMALILSLAAAGPGYAADRDPDAAVATPRVSCDLLDVRTDAPRTATHAAWANPQGGDRPSAGSAGGHRPGRQRRVPQGRPGTGTGHAGRAGTRTAHRQRAAGHHGPGRDRHRSSEPHRHPLPEPGGPYRLRGQHQRRRPRGLRGHRDRGTGGPLHQRRPQQRPGPVPDPGPALHPAAGNPSHGSGLPGQW